METLKNIRCAVLEERDWEVTSDFLNTRGLDGFASFLTTGAATKHQTRAPSRLQKGNAIFIQLLLDLRVRLMNTTGNLYQLSLFSIPEMQTDTF